MGKIDMMKRTFWSLATALATAMAPIAASAQEAGAAEAVQEDQSALFPAETVRADLDALYSAMQAASVDLYAYRSKADFDAFHAGLRAQITAPMSRIDAAILLQRFAAFARIGHIRSYSWLNETFGEFSKGSKFAPIFIRVEDDSRVFLTDHADAQANAPAGAQLIAIDGEPIARILARMRDLISAERDYMANTLLEESFPALFWSQNRDKGAFTLKLKVDGETVESRVSVMSFGDYRAMGTNEGDAPATSQLGTDFNARAFRMVDATIAYLRPGPFSALEGEEPVEGRSEAAMISFLDASFEEMIASGARDLIIDLRNNSGGDISFSDPMVAWFADKPFKFSSAFTLRASAPVKAHYRSLTGADQDVSPFLARLASEENAQPNGALYPFAIDTIEPRTGVRFEGRVWVLINRKSYSNATSTAALIKDYGFGTIMGEETADVPNSFASIFQYTLPGTGFLVDLTKSYFVRPSGDETVRGVLPDIALSRQPLGSDIDVMLEQAVEQIRAAN